MKQEVYGVSRAAIFLHRNRIKLLTFILFTLAIMALPKVAEASTVTPEANKVNVVLDFLEEAAVITAGSNNSTKFYVSTDNKNWEALSSNVLDISTFLKPKETTLYFKGNKDTAVRDVKLPGEDASLKAVYQVVEGIGRVAFSGNTQPVEFRKGTNGRWQQLSAAASFYLTAPYETYGATLYFRTTGTANRRPGKTVTVKIPKKPSAPSVKADGSKLYISGVKPGETQYRIGDSLEWRLFPANATIKTIDLKELMGPELPANTPLPAGTIEFRTIHNDSKKKVASAIKIIELAAQPIAPTNVTLSGLNLIAADSNKKKNYEYTVVKATATLDLKKAKWITFTSAKQVLLKDLVVGDKIYVRAKSYTDSATKVLVPASAYKEIVVLPATSGN